jgi:prephenate dehydrogenase
MINKLVVVGVGLIGGSFALALRQAGMVRQVTGVGRSHENLETALRLGVVDSIEDDLASAIKDADVILLAIPVSQTGQVMSHIASHIGPHTVVTDAGSTKQDVILAARTHFAAHFSRFVPGHPIAGAESSGVQAAHASLFLDKHVVLTPVEETSQEAVARITTLWQSCGACVSHMPPQQHDAVLAIMSHLPHLLAFALMNLVLSSTSNHPEELLRFAGSGFRDFTRIAGSSPEMWRDICLANRESLIRQIDAYQGEVTALRDMLIAADGASLEKVFAEARKARQQCVQPDSAASRK